MPIMYEVPDYKRVRVIVDTDAACEADDPFAIAHALMCKKFDVRAVLAEQFGNPQTTRKSYDAIEKLVETMQIRVPVFMGEEGTFPDRKERQLSPGAKYLIEEAMKTEEKPLYVLCLGAITNVACAIDACPAIASKMTVVWIGGQDLDRPNRAFREFNSGNDIEAANYIMESDVDLWLIPVNVYGTMNIGLAEIQRRISVCGEVGKYLFENMTQYNMSEHATWTQGESWSLGDSPAVGVVMNPGCGKYEYREAPIFSRDTVYQFKEGRRKIRVYTSIDARFILEDFIAKLELLYS